MRPLPKNRRHPEQTASLARTAGIRPENLKVTVPRDPSTSLGLMVTAVYPRRLRVWARKQLVNEFLLERNYERKVLV